MKHIKTYDDSEKVMVMHPEEQNDTVAVEELPPHKDGYNRILYYNEKDGVYAEYTEVVEDDELSS